MLILQLKRGQTVVSANVASDGVVDSLKDYWGDVVSVWDTLDIAAHREALDALSSDSSVLVNGKTAIITDKSSNVVWSGQVVAINS